MGAKRDLLPGEKSPQEVSRPPWSYVSVRTFEALHSETPMCVVVGCEKIAVSKGARSRRCKKLKSPTGAIKLWYCKEHRAIADIEWNLPTPDPMEVAAEKEREREGRRQSAKRSAAKQKLLRKQNRKKRRKPVRWKVVSGTRAMGVQWRKCRYCPKAPLEGRRRCADHLHDRSRCYDCSAPPLVGQTRCARHRPQHTLLNQLSYVRKPRRGNVKAMAKAARRKRVERTWKRLRGECYECKESATRGGRCEPHAERHNETSLFSASNRRSKTRGRGRPMREMWYDLE